MGRRSRKTMRNVPTRLITGAYILHSGITKLSAGPEQEQGLYATASGAYPALQGLTPHRFVRTLAMTEIAIGTLLLTPFVPAGLAGLVLTTFSGGLVGMYLRTPALHKPHSVWPTAAGTAISKDSWMLGIGVGMLIGSAERGRRR